MYDAKNISGCGIEALKPVAKLIRGPCTVDYFEQFCAISKVPMALIKETTVYYYFVKK